MLNITPFGWFHTAISLVSLFGGLYALLRHHDIRYATPLGKTYTWFTVATCLTSFFLMRTGKLSEAHGLTVLTLILCIGVGSVNIPFRNTAEIIFRAIAGWEQPSGSAVAIILYTRLPRVLCVALVGAMLALGGCAMQGLLRNPLADGSTLGVSSGASLGAAGLSFSFQLDTLGLPGGATLAQAIHELVQKAETDVVLIVDEVQQAAGTAGTALMAALKAARDAVNGDPGAQGHFLFIGTGSHRSLMNDMATKPAHPFKGAVTAPFEPLQQDYVAWKLDQLAADAQEQDMGYRSK